MNRLIWHWSDMGRDSQANRGPASALREALAELRHDVKRWQLPACAFDRAVEITFDTDKNTRHEPPAVSISLHHRGCVRNRLGMFGARRLRPREHQRSEGSARSGAGVLSGRAESSMNDELGRRKFLKLGALCGISGLTGIYGVSSALAFEVNTYRIPVPHLPSSFDGFTLVQLTDLHHGFGIPISVVDRVIHQANLIEKDAIVCTGDYVHGGDGLDAIDTVWSRLMTLKAKSGVYSVLGNHDHWHHQEDRSFYWLEKSGQSVRHRAVPISRGADRIWIGGSGDYSFDQLGIDEAFRHAPSGDCKILLSHNPDAADTAFETRVDLMICGHTHGGQIALPPFAARLSGLQERSGMNVYISRGIGWYIAPIRINCAAEISVLKLVPSEGADGIALDGATSALEDLRPGDVRGRRARASTSQTAGSARSAAAGGR